MVVIEVWLTQLILKFDLYIVSITDPLEGLSYTVFLGGLIWLGRFEDIVKFAIARSLSVLIKLCIIRVYLAKTRQHIQVHKPIPIEDHSSHTKYWVHTSTKEFFIQFSYISVFGFAYNIIERFIQVSLLSLADIGANTLIMSIGDSLIKMFTSPLIDFFTNLFNLKFSEYVVSIDSKRLVELAEDLKTNLFRSIKYLLILHQLLAIYAHYLFVDDTIYLVFGKKMGQRVKLIRT
jgi:hypothetical protein